MLEPISTILNQTLARFLVVGTGCAFLNLIALDLLLRVKVNAFAAGLAAYAVAFGVAYALQRNWTFRGTTAHGRALPRYFILQLGCAIGSGGLAQALSYASPIPSLVIATVTIGSASLTSFLVSRLWVFRSKDE